MPKAYRVISSLFIHVLDQVRLTYPQRAGSPIVGVGRYILFLRTPSSLILSKAVVLGTDTSA